MPKTSKHAAERRLATAGASGVSQSSSDGKGRESRSVVGSVRRALPILGPVGVVAVVAVALVVLADLFLNPKNDAVIGGQFVEDQGRDHALPGQPHPLYNSTPPTSGWHYDKPAPWGISAEPIGDETQIHNLEHGGVMVQYSCSDGCPQLVEQLKGVVGRYKSKVILAPYAKPLPTRIALTAWNWIDKFDQFDERRIVSFIEAHKDRGPEFVPD